MSTEIIICEIPHQMPPRVWTAFGWDDAAARAAQRDGQTPGMVRWDRAELIKCWGSEDEAPGEALDLIAAHGVAVEVQDAPNSSYWVAPDKAPSLADVVMGWIGRDVHAAWFFESAEEVMRWLGQYDGHQAGKAKTAVRREAELMGWIEPESDADEADE